jgi:UDP-N-acetylmuramoyl-L-alanyl-D-glutamate--2,6-diaminopimelate ligase
VRLSDLFEAAGGCVGGAQGETKNQEETGTSTMAAALTNLSDSDLRGLAVTGLTADSRRVAPGYLFAALPGARADGRAFIAEAVSRGATAILAPHGTRLEDLPAGVALLTDPRPRRAFARMAARFHGRQPETVVAVTGTNGKTSTVLFARRIWAVMGKSAGSLGTLGAGAPGYERVGTLTTPDPALLHEVLAEMAAAGCDHLAMEASSHGLDQDRLDGVRLAAAAFTNLSHDHLDYHGTMARYLAAKARLFSEVMAPGGVAVLNADSAEFETLSDLCRRQGHRVLSYGRAGTDLCLDDLAPAPDGQDLRLTVLGQRRRVRLPVAGAFQAMNALAALGLVLATGSHVDPAVAALAHLDSVPGRMQQVAAPAGGGVVYVDYAHTPDALETVLAALRPHVGEDAGRLICVFGCGGDRDAGKRPEMGEIAARLADVAIVTADNPRSEDPAAIRAAILAACPGGREIGDRAEAIRAAVTMMGPGGVVLIAGKGHEQGQIVGDRVLPFDDADQVRAAVAARQPGEGSP